MITQSNYQVHKDFIVTNNLTSAIHSNAKKRLHLADTYASQQSRHAPTSATEPSVQLDLQPGTICRRTSDSRTCHAAVYQTSRWRHFSLASWIKA